MNPVLPVQVFHAPDGPVMGWDSDVRMDGSPQAQLLKKKSAPLSQVHLPAASSSDAPSHSAWPRASLVNSSPSARVSIHASCPPDSWHNRCAVSHETSATLA